MFSCVFVTFPYGVLGQVCYLPRGGAVLWYFHTYLGMGHFLGSKFFNFNVLGFSEKVILLGVWRFCGYFWGVITKLYYILIGVISMHFMVFSLGQGTEWGLFFGLLKFQIFLGCLNFLIFLGVGVVNGRCWARGYVWRKKWEYPPPTRVIWLYWFLPYFALKKLTLVTVGRSQPYI